MSKANNSDRVREFYDVLSPYYQAVWGEHIHHGYWIHGDESKEVAQLQLVEHLALAASIERGCKILDVGCGMGGSSIYLARRYGAEVTGITISPVQVEMAKAAAAKEKQRVRFALMDAEAMTFAEPFDVVWAMESISHLQDVAKFFGVAAKLLRPGGVMALIDWFKKEKLQAGEEKKSIAAIETSMLVELRTMSAYAEWMEESGVEITRREVLNAQCKKTWDICLDFLKEKRLWELAAKQGPRFLGHLRGFRAMRAGFASGNFVYGLMVGRKV